MQTIIANLHNITKSKFPNARKVEFEIYEDSGEILAKVIDGEEMWKVGKSSDMDMSWLDK